MKRFVAFAGIFCILAGMCLADRGASSGYGGRLTVYGTDGCETICDGGQLADLLRFSGCATRLDICGEKANIASIIRQLGGKTLWCETPDGLTVTYAYSPLLSEYEILSGKRVNIMLAVRSDGSVSVGCPLLLGSY